MVPPMQWWNDFLDWFNSSEGNRIVTTMVLPFIAIIVAGIIAAVVARGSVARLVARQETATRASAVEALIAVGEKASQWSGLPGSTREHFEAQSSVASIRVRLLPASGSAMASSWAEYQLADIKRNSANFSVQADQGYAEYRDRLIEWHHRPSRARKLFTGDLERFRIDAASDDTDLIERQRRWKAEQSAPATVATPTASRTDDFTVVPTPAATPVTPAAAKEPVKEPAKRPASENISSTPLVPSAASRAFTPNGSSGASTAASANSGSASAGSGSFTPASSSSESPNSGSGSNSGSSNSASDSSAKSDAPAASNSSYEGSGNTEVIEATIDEDSTRVG